MKKLEAVILPSCLDAVRAGLRRRGVSGELTLTEVRHSDTHAPSSSVSACAAGPLAERVKLELLLPDRQVDKAVSVILRYALPDSHEAGGHVTLIDVSEALRITPPTSDIGNSPI